MTNNNCAFLLIYPENIDYGSANVESSFFV